MFFYPKFTFLEAIEDEITLKILLEYKFKLYFGTELKD